MLSANDFSQKQIDAIKVLRDDANNDFNYDGIGWLIVELAGVTYAAYWDEGVEYPGILEVKEFYIDGKPSDCYAFAEEISLMLDC